MNKTTEKHKRQKIDGGKDDEGMSVKKMKYLRSISKLEKRKLGEMEGETEKKRTGDQKEREKKLKKRGTGKGKDESGDGGTSGENSARKGREDEKRQEVEESQIIKKSRDNKQNLKFWSVSHSSTVISGDKNIKQGIHRQERDEVYKCGLVHTPITHGDTDRKKCRENRDQRDENSDGDQYILWVQCSKPECGKWRRLSDGVDPSVLPDDWTCQNNTDTTFSSCSAPEEKSSVPKEEMFFYSLVPGSLVWAQQSGYPWWPAIVDRDPNTEEYLEFCLESDLTPCKCHVTYFGEPVTRAWVTCNRVRDYAALSEDKLLNVVEKGLKDSICMVKEALQLSLKERLVKFGFRSRYVSERESSEDSDIAEIMELFCGKSGNDCSNEDSLTKKQRSKGRKQKERKIERKRSREVIDDKTYREGEKKKKMKKKKKLKEGNEDLINVTVKKGKEQNSCPPTFSLKKKKQQIEDQKVPQGAMETSTDITFDLDSHSLDSERERERDVEQRRRKERLED